MEIMKCFQKLLSSLTRPEVSLQRNFVNRKLTALEFITVAPKVLSFRLAMIVSFTFLGCSEFSKS